LAKWVGYILTFVTALSLVLKLFNWGKSGPLAHLTQNAQILWVAALTAISFVLLIWVSTLHGRFASGFADNFRGDFKARWDFEGPWRLVEKGTLLVTGSDAGGITKVGALWENYTFAFKARIINGCVGVVVRAQDLNNYYMFQIHPDKVRPHRRATIPVIETETSSGPSEKLQPVKFLTGWQVFDPPVPLSPHLDGWFDARVRVRGHSASLWINDELVLQREGFLQIPMGKVGFRNWGAEEAQVRRVRVVLES
jgi:hypothetical protein